MFQFEQSNGVRCKQFQWGGCDANGTNRNFLSNIIRILYQLFFLSRIYVFCFSYEIQTCLNRLRLVSAVIEMHVPFFQRNCAQCSKIEYSPFLVLKGKTFIQLHLQTKKNGEEKKKSLKQLVTERNINFRGKGQFFEMMKIFRFLFNDRSVSIADKVRIGLQ